MELWTSLPAIVRYPIALGLIALGVVLLFYSELKFRTCGLLIGLGFVGLILGPTSSDKNGYRF